MKRFLEKWTLWLPPLLATLFFCDTEPRHIFSL